MKQPEVPTRLPSGVHKAITKTLDENLNNSIIKGFAIIHAGPAGWYRIEQKSKDEPLMEDMALCLSLHR